MFRKLIETPITEEEINKKITKMDIIGDRVDIEKEILEGRLLNFLADKFKIIERGEKRVAYVISSKEDKDLWIENTEDYIYKGEDGSDMIWGAKWITNKNNIPEIDKKHEDILCLE